MIRIRVLRDASVYSVDHEAYLVGWVGHAGETYAVVFTDDGDTPWEVPIRLVEMIL